MSLRYIRYEHCEHVLLARLKLCVFREGDDKLLQGFPKVPKAKAS